MLFTLKMEDEWPVLQPPRRRKSLTSGRAMMMGGIGVFVVIVIGVSCCSRGLGGVVLDMFSYPPWLLLEL
jgi:hypothetical protein